MKGSSKKQSDFVKFALSGKEPFILFLKISQSVESVKLLPGFLKITLRDRTSFPTTLSMPFSYFFYIIGRYVKSLEVVKFCLTKRPFFKGLLDNEGLTETELKHSFKNPRWVNIFKSVKKITANMELFQTLSNSSIDFSFDSVTVTSRMNCDTFSNFLKLRNLKSKELTIELCTCDYDDSVFKKVQSWPSLTKINLVITSHLFETVELLDIINSVCSIFPNLEFCHLTNVIDSDFWIPVFIRRILSEVKRQFLSYTGKVQVDVRWEMGIEVFPNCEDDYVNDRLRETYEEVREFLPNYMYDNDNRIHEWRRKVSLTPKLSFESVITVTENE